MQLTGEKEMLLSENLGLIAKSCTSHEVKRTFFTGVICNCIGFKCSTTKVNTSNQKEERKKKQIITSLTSNVKGNCESAITKMRSG